MKLFIAGLLTESNTFSPFPTTLSDFKRVGHDDDMIAKYVEEQLDVFRRGAESKGWDVVQGLGAAAVPAGRTTAAAYRELKHEILGDLRQAMPVDVVMLALHGAMAAVGCDDCEGDLLQAVREIVGPGIPVGAALDPHANMSTRMTEMADVLVCYKEWPHVDVLLRAEAVFRLTSQAAEGLTKPCMPLTDCHMLDLFHTMEQPAKGLVDRTRALEGTDGILSISIVHGFPFGDVADAGTKVLVVTDNAPEKASELSRELADQVFALRGQTHPAYLDLQAGLDAVAAAERFPVVIADTADAPGAGSPGDATYILHADPAKKRALIVKSVNNFRAGFEHVAGTFVHIAGPGAMDTTLTTLLFKNIRRPRWPFDEPPFAGALGL